MSGYKGIETGSRHLEDISIANELIPTVRDEEGEVAIYDLPPPTQPTRKINMSPNVFYSVDDFLGKDLFYDRATRPEAHRGGLVTSIRLAGASLLAGIGH